jgi:TIR domain
VNVTRLRLTTQVDSRARTVRITYVPVGRDDAGNERELPEWQGSTPATSWERLRASVPTKVERFQELVRSSLIDVLPKLEVDGKPLSPQPALCCIELRTPVENVAVHYFPAGEAAPEQRTQFLKLSGAAAQIAVNLEPTFDQLAWAHFREKYAAPPALAKKEVMVSYRSGLEDFAEGIAIRLGREGFVPFFDHWDIRPGDSLPRELGHALERAYAVIIIVSQGYEEGKWARQELEGAITKMVEDGTRLIPVLYDDARLPELLRSLRRVDCRDHTGPEKFERQFREIIDVLNGIELNPYRV